MDKQEVKKIIKRYQTEPNLVEGYNYLKDRYGFLAVIIDVNNLPKRIYINPKTNRYYDPNKPYMINQL